MSKKIILKTLTIKSKTFILSPVVSLFYLKQHANNNPINFKSFMKKTILLLTLLTAFSFTINAQRAKDRIDLPYKTAIGIRYSPFGFSLKLNDSYRSRSMEFIGYFQDGFIGAFYYYWNFTLDKNRTFRFYLGGGGQGGYTKKGENEGAEFGAGGIIGLDYKFKKLPINISTDWQPSYQFGESNGWQTSWGGIALRLSF